MRLRRVLRASALDVAEPPEPAAVARNPPNVEVVDGSVRGVGVFGAIADCVLDARDQHGELHGLEDVEGEPPERALHAVGRASCAFEVLACGRKRKEVTGGAEFGRGSSSPWISARVVCGWSSVGEGGPR